MAVRTLGPAGVRCHNRLCLARRRAGTRRSSWVSVMGSVPGVASTGADEISKRLRSILRLGWMARQWRERGRTSSNGSGPCSSPSTGKDIRRRTFAAFISPSPERRRSASGANRVGPGPPTQHGRRDRLLEEFNALRRQLQSYESETRDVAAGMRVAFGQAQLNQIATTDKNNGNNVRRLRRGVSLRWTNGEDDIHAKSDKLSS
jgi:hypothetical protein